MNNNDIINEIDSLTNLLHSATITFSRRAELCAMRKSSLENFIRDNHKYKISTYEKKGVIYYTTRLNGSTKIHARSLEELYDRLYRVYSGKEFAETASIESVFIDALEWHTSKKNNAPKTVRRTQYTFERYIKGSCFANKPLRDIDEDDMDIFFNSFKNQLTKKRLCDIKSIINWIFKYSLKKKIISVDIASCYSVSDIKTTAEKKVGELAYTREETEKILHALLFSKSTYAMAICFNIFVGLRYSELADLKKSDYDPYHNLLTVTHAKTFSGNIKNGSEGVKIIPLGKDAKWLLERIIAAYPESEWIFPNKAGNQITNNRLNEVLKKTCLSLGIPYRSNHKLRAHFITEVAYYSDVNRARILGGQNNVRTTELYLNKGIMPKDLETMDKAFDYGLSTIFDQKISKEKTS